MPLLSSVHGISSTILSNVFIRLPLPPVNAALNRQIVIVTGANTGLGLEASRHLLRLGVEKLIMGVRSLDKGEQAKKELLASTQRAEVSIEVWLLDMDNYNSVKNFASRVAALPRLDALLANAGMFPYVFKLVEGNEQCITTNVVSTFLLIMLILPKLQESAARFNMVPRIVIPNSALHYLAPLKELELTDREIFVTLNDKKTADIPYRYHVTKLLVLFVVRELAKRLKSSKKPLVVINTPNPSWCKSGLVQMPEDFGTRMAEKLVCRTTEMGSRALVHGLLSGAESHGHYLTNCHIQAPASFVTNSKGAQIQQKFFDELMEKLNGIAPEIQIA